MGEEMQALIYKEEKFMEERILRIPIYINPSKTFSKSNLMRIRGFLSLE